MVEVWLFYVISAVIIWGVTSIVDKIILTKYLNTFSYFIVDLPVVLFFLIGILLFSNVSFNAIPFYLAFSAGAIAMVGAYLYGYTMKKEEASRIVALSSLYPAFIAVFASIFLNEIFSFESYVGIMVMILGASLISYKKGSSKKMISLFIIAMLIVSNLFYAIENTFSKMSLGFYGFWEFLAVYFIGRSFITTTSLGAKNIREDFVKEIKKLKKGIVLITISSSFVWIISLIFYFYAASLGPITLVSTISITSPLVTFLFASIITKLRPDILKEKIDRSELAIKFFAIVLILVGTYLVSA